MKTADKISMNSPRNRDHKMTHSTSLNNADHLYESVLSSMSVIMVCLLLLCC